MNEICLRQVVQSALNQLAADTQNANAEIRVDVDGTVFGHESTLVQIVVNLVSNAIKFATPKVVPKIKIWSHLQDSNRCRLWVEDNGIGIDLKHKNRIFQVFERLHGIETYPGTGIGLAIVSRACQRLGGSFGVESEVGQGSRFWIEFATSRKAATDREFADQLGV